jgi:hypothetical protein
MTEKKNVYDKYTEALEKLQKENLRLKEEIRLATTATEETPAPAIVPEGKIKLKRKKFLHAAWGFNHPERSFWFVQVDASNEQKKNELLADGWVVCE